MPGSTTASIAPAVGPLLREWRQRRHRSQMELALEAGVSARHISFLETGRARPSRQMVIGLASKLEVPLRQRNELLAAAGFAPEYRELAYQDPGLAPVRAAIERVLAAHYPHPALVVDRHWRLVTANRGFGLFTVGVAPHLLEPPANALRISLHPEGMAPRILNLGEWRAHTLARLERQARLSGDATLAGLIEELRGYPGVPAEEKRLLPEHEVFVPLRLRDRNGQQLSFLGTVATFGTAVEVTAAELSIETFFPADERTAAATRAFASR